MSLSEQLQSALRDEYTVERELAGGGMSRVFLATERALARKVVIKVLPPELSAGVNSDRFRREIQFAAQLHHPHIVPVLSAGERNDLLYYTMPYIEGESLRARLRGEGRLPVRNVVRILHDVVDALAYAHARGIIHRDIKPDNILTFGAHALVTDFGVAKALTAALPITGATTAGIAIGTPAYMAPEQLAADPSADHRVDLYAVGLLAYELLTGESPFTGPSPQATMAAQLTRTPDPLHVVRPDVPPQLSAIIMRCLEKSPENRPPSADALLAELDAVTTPQGVVFSDTATKPIGGASTAEAATAPMTPVGAADTAPMTPIDPIFFSTPWYRRPIAAVVALVVLVGAVFLFANSGRERGPREAARTASRTPAADSAANADSSAAADSADTDDTSDVTLPVPEHARRGAAAPKSIVLTRADSEAIAEAVRKRMEARGAPAKADTQQNGAVVVRIPPESIAVVFQRSINDSVKEVLKRLQMQQVERMPEMRDLRGMAGQSGRDDPLARMRELARHPERVTPVAPIVTPPTGGERRIVVMPFQIALRDRSRDSLGIVLADGVRNAITQRARDLDVVDAATTMEASRITHNQIALGWTLRADHVLSGTLVQRDDSLYLTALLTDVRNGRVIGVARAGAAATDDPTVLIPQLGDRAVALIRRAESMPVAPPVPPSSRP